MRYTLEQAIADESLPHWWTEKGCPDWARTDDYQDIPADLAFEVRYGLPEVTLRKRLKARRANAVRRTKRDTERAARTPEQIAAHEKAVEESRRINRLRSRVTMYRNRIAAAEADGGWRSAVELPSYRIHLADAEARLSDMLTAALRDAFAALPY